jgi:hypothetical protein
MLISSQIKWIGTNELDLMHLELVACLAGQFCVWEVPIVCKKQLPPEHVFQCKLAPTTCQNNKDLKIVCTFEKHSSAAVNKWHSFGSPSRTSSENSGPKRTMSANSLFFGLRLTINNTLD